jgi:hypothetical protein
VRLPRSYATSSQRSSAVSWSPSQGWLLGSKVPRWARGLGGGVRTGRLGPWHSERGPSVMRHRTRADEMHDRKSDARGAGPPAMTRWRVRITTARVVTR